MNSQTDIAVVIVNFNGGRYIQRCLAALADQTESPDQLIVVDNGSSDGSGQWVATHHPDITLITLTENLGFAAANNRAIAAVSGCQWVALLNPDTEVRPDWIRLLRRAILDHPDVSLFSCRLESLSNPDELDGTGDLFHVSGLSWRRDHGAPVTQSRSADETVFSPCAAAALYRLDDLRRAGCFDEHYFCYNEDTDLAFRMRLAGAACLHLDHCVVAHAGSGITGSASDFTVYHGHRNLVWTYVRNMPNRLFWRYLPAHLLLNLVTVAMYTLKGRPGVILRAKRDALRGLPRVWRQRRAQQQLLGKHNRGNIDRLHQSMTKGLLKPYLGRRG